MSDNPLRDMIRERMAKMGLSVKALAEQTNHYEAVRKYLSESGPARDTGGIILAEIFDALGLRVVNYREWRAKEAEKKLEKSFNSVAEPADESYD